MPFGVSLNNKTKKRKNIAKKDYIFLKKGLTNILLYAILFERSAGAVKNLMAE